ncbi:cytochrome c oxidase subunit 3 family protein [bacterium]|nr:cytochrome c oxidase subunit 3 family protein [bacterium]NSX01231.1 cytochrome c oxidase subunit 3 family protein [Deltaproteobacteria bacterium TMED58]RZP16658.1 MAG: cytochrome c oxidase subunit 3 family protein [Candidatus Dadabacteria bacterium]
MVPSIDDHADDGEHHFDPVTEHESAKLGMWLFLATELLLFGGLFAAYAIYRAKYPEMFMDGSKSLDVVLGTVNTVILIFSSLTVAVAVKAIQENRIKLVKLMLWITIICAAIFAVNKYFEYTYKFSKGIFPGTDIFYSIYFASTGVHMLHVFIGMIVLGILLRKVYKGKYSKENFTAIEIGGLYWHLVDLIWIYLFPLLYLVG